MSKENLSLENLKVSNLPELQGWKDKQETLVKENPFVEITDNKTYETACKSRTALLKGRTSLEGQDKLIASKLAGFRKDVKSETEKLISITLPHEEKQQVEVKRYESIKENERVERERIENERISAINNRIESLESKCYELIQSMNFINVDKVGDEINSVVNVDFDYEEYDVLFETVKSRVQIQFDAKFLDIQEKENQRIENERLKAESEENARKAKELQDKLDEAEKEAKRKAIEAQDKIDSDNLEREQQAKKEKQQVFEIRKNRLAGIGFELNSESGFFLHPYLFDGLNQDGILNYSAIDFETIFLDAMEKIKKAINDEIENEKAFELRTAKLLEIGFVYSDEHDTYFIANDSDFILLSDDIKNESEDEFEETLLELKQVISDYKLSKADSEKLKKENKARIKRLAGDKELLGMVVESLGNVVNSDLVGISKKMINQETKDFIEKANVRIQTLKNELLIELNNL